MLSSRLSRQFNKLFSFNNLKQEYVILRTISTSKKNSESTTATTVVKGANTETCIKNYPQGKWQTYGFALNEKEDKFHMHMTFFLGVTISIVLVSFYMAYSPNELDWIQREAFLELRRREQQGLPLIDPNFVDPSKIVLPSDEELGDTEIII